MNGLTRLLSGLAAAPATAWAHGFLPPSPASVAHPIVPVPEDEAYIIVTLRTARLLKARRGTWQLHGVVHAFIEVPQPRQAAKFHVVSLPDELASLDGENAGRIVNLNSRLVGPVPYKGNGLRLELGLFAARSENLMTPYLKLLESLTSVAGVSVISAAQPLVTPISQGMEALLGVSDALTLEIGIAQDMFPLTTGSYAVIGVGRDRIDTRQLNLSSDGVLLNPDLSPVNASYFVYEVAVTDHREDWYLLPLVGEAYYNLTQDVATGNLERVDYSFKHFSRVVSGSMDLIPGDALALAKKVDGELNLRLRAAGTSGAETSGMPKPESLMPW